MALALPQQHEADREKRFRRSLLASDRSEVFQLNVVGRLSDISDSKRQFRKLTSSSEENEEWFAKPRRPPN
jgi:hypothetical protein